MIVSGAKKAAQFHAWAVPVVDPSSAGAVAFIVNVKHDA